MRDPFLVFHWERIAASLRSLLDFVVRCTLWVLCLTALVFAFIQLISWVIGPWVCEANSMGVLVWDRELGHWEVKGLFSCHALQSVNSKN